MTAKESLIRVCESHGLFVLADYWCGYVSVRVGEDSIRTIRMCEIPEDGVDDLVMSWILEGTWS